MTVGTNLAFAAFSGGLGMCFSMLCTQVQNESSHACAQAAFVSLAGRHTCSRFARGNACKIQNTTFGLRQNVFLCFLGHRKVENIDCDCLAVLLHNSIIISFILLLH